MNESAAASCTAGRREERHRTGSHFYRRTLGASDHRNLWYNAPPTMLPAGGRQHRGCIIPQAVTHNLVLLKTGGINARNMLS